MRVRRRHYRGPFTRPGCISRRPYTSLVSAEEALKMFDVGVDIGQHRSERHSDYDRGWADGWLVGWRDAQGGDSR